MIGDMWKQNNYLAEHLKSVQYLSIQYEKLYYTTEPSEWQKLWDYVVATDTTTSTNVTLTMEGIRNHTASWPELPPPRNKTISNYNQISKYLKQLGYAKYLEPLPKVELPPVDWDAIECVGTTKKIHMCDLTNASYGVPAILVGFGRSGTSVTWDTLASLTSQPAHGQKSIEATGSGQSGALAQLQDFPHEHGKCWMERILCELQRKNRQRKRGKKSAIYGTKWKASLRLFAHR